MSSDALARRVCVVTGATAGIGKEIARGLVAQGATVVIGCRNPERGARAIDELGASLPPGSPAKLELGQLDLASQQSIRAFAAELLERHAELHVLVNNAGIWPERRELGPDGIEVTWATNVLAYHLLARLLEARLTRSAPARIVNVVSTAAGGLDLDDPEFERRPFGGIAAYRQSKQANRMLSWSLAERLANTRVTVNAVHPGGVSTELAREHNALAKLVFRVFGRTPSKGADTAVWLASAPELAETTNTLWKNRRQLSCKFRDAARQRALWELCERQTGLSS